MLTLYCLKKDQNLAEHGNLSEISNLIAEPSNVVWLDALDPSREEMEFLAVKFGFHPLAIDDYFAPHHRPKVDEYPGYYFIVMHSIRYTPETGETEPLELDLFVAKNYIVTLHKQPMPILKHITDSWKKSAEKPVPA